MRTTETGALLVGASSGAGGPTVAFGNAAFAGEANSSNWMVSVRAHRDFLP